MDMDRIVDIVICGGVLTIIILKLTNVITIPWLWLLSPLWILVGFGVILAIILTIMCLISTHINKGEKK